MTKLVDKLTGIRNWIGKFFLLFLGMVMLLGAVYADLLEMFQFTETKAPEWTEKHKWFLIIGVAFVVGGVFLNNMLDAVSTGLKNFANKFTK